MCETAVATNMIMTRVTGKRRHIGTALCALLAGASIVGAAHAATDKGKNLFLFNGVDGTYCTHHAQKMPPMDAILGANAALGLATTSSARTDPIKSVAVSWADLDLNSPAGIEVMRGRLESASRKVCGSEPLTRDFNGYGYYSECVKDTLRRAIDGLPAGYAYNLRNGRTHEVIAEK